MNKNFFILPFMAGILTACSSQAPAPVVNATGIKTTDGASTSQMPTYQAQYGWQPVLSSVSPVPSVSPYPLPPSIPTVTAPQSSVPALPPTPVAPVQTTASEVLIPRDQNYQPIYSQINKGFYRDEHYVVRKGDTMFLIAYIAGKDVSELAALNNLTEPYKLYIGQVLKVNQASPVPQPAQTEALSPVPPTTQIQPVTTPVPKQKGVSPTAAHSNIKWQWPTQGNIIAGFSEAEGGNKGIDIAGKKGQPIKAAAAGQIAYAGSHILGYGNMIIIKHNNNFLSAYAHNDTLKVKQQDKVKAGQVIATMGSSGTNANKLHFEIRYMGKSVDPLLYLPK